MGADVLPGKHSFCLLQQFLVEFKACMAGKRSLVERLYVDTVADAEITENFTFSQTYIKQRHLAAAPAQISTADSEIDNGSNLPMMSLQMPPNSKSGFDRTDAGNELVRKRSVDRPERFKGSHFLLSCSNNQMHDMKFGPRLNFHRRLHVKMIAAAAAAVFPLVCNEPDPTMQDDLKLEAYHYHLPEKHIAQYPAEKRDHSRLLVLNRKSGAVEHLHFHQIDSLFSPGDLLVVNDLFLTKTARLADYVLPGASFLERSEVHFHPKHQMVTLTQKVAEISGVKNDYQLWRDLAHRLGFGEKYFPWENEEAVMQWILEPSGISLEELRKHPEGLVYKPVRHQKYKTRPLPTPSGKIEFASAYLKKYGLSEIPEYIPPYHVRHNGPDFPFILTTGARKSLFYHSRHQNIARFRTVHPTAEAEIHPEDAADLGIKDKELVRIVSEIGSLEIPARVVGKAELRKGVIEIYHGWEEWRVNFVTHDSINDPICGFPLLKGVPVRIEKI